jgi:hypothetical protein
VHVSPCLCSFVFFACVALAGCIAGFARLFACGDTCVRACAGPLAWGNFNSTDCPAGSYRIIDAAQCQAAAMATRNYWARSASKPDVPRGCMYTADGDVYLNDHPTGGASPYGRPLCAVGARLAQLVTPPPTPPLRARRRHTRARALAHAHTSTHTRTHTDSL